jgi:hypothetical protein
LIAAGDEPAPSRQAKSSHTAFWNVRLFALKA